MMNISDETLDVLKNFASINPNIVISPGQKIKTISEAKNIMASAEIVEDFPQEFGVYDLNEFLSVMNLVSPAELSFDDKFTTISSNGDNRSKIKYYFSEPAILTTPQKDISMPDCEFGISLSESVLDQIRKAAAVLGHSELVLSGDNGIVTAIGSDISERKIIEQEIIETKQFYENITEGVQDGIWVTDKNDVIFYANSAMEKIAGVPLEQIQGKNVLSDFSKDITVMPFC